MWWNGALAGFALLVPVALGYGYHLGNGAGEASGYARARDEVAAVSWANTVNGKLARRIDQASEKTIPAIAACPTDHGWKRDKRDRAYRCFGATTDAKTYTGWLLPCASMIPPPTAPSSSHVQTSTPPHSKPQH